MAASWASPNTVSRSTIVRARGLPSADARTSSGIQSPDRPAGKRYPTLQRRQATGVLAKLPGPKGCSTSSNGIRRKSPSRSRSLISWQPLPSRRSWSWTRRRRNTWCIRTCPIRLPGATPPRHPQSAADCGVRARVATELAPYERLDVAATGNLNASWEGASDQRFPRLLVRRGQRDDLCPQGQSGWFSPVRSPRARPSGQAWQTFQAGVRRQSPFPEAQHT